jgi:hypothetical protein
MSPIVTSNQHFAVTATTGCNDMIEDGTTPPQRLVRIQHSLVYMATEEKGWARILKEIETNCGRSGRLLNSQPNGMAKCLD